MPDVTPKTESGLTADAVAMARPALMDRAYELALTTGRVYVVGEDTRKRWEQEAASAAVAEVREAMTDARYVTLAVLVNDSATPSEQKIAEDVDAILRAALIASESGA